MPPPPPEPEAPTEGLGLGVFPLEATGALPMLSGLVLVPWRGLDALVPKALGEGL